MADKQPASENVAATGTPTIKLGLFIGGLVVALIAGFGLGKVISPASPAAGNTTGAPGSDVVPANHTHPPVAAAAGSDVGGLAISYAGYTIVPKGSDGGQISFVINGADGKAITKYAVVHEKEMHTILVKRDLGGYQHVHPTRAADGTWSVKADVSQPGPWRVFADFTAVNAAGAQTALTLGYDLTAPGDYKPGALPAPARESNLDGQTVTYEGTPTVGATSPLLFRSASPLEPYLGAFGHLVVIRDGDLGYIHVHPEPALAGGAAKFWLAAPSSGTYRMFFDYQTGGKVRTASYTLVVP